MPPVRRYEITDFEWSIIEPLLPNKPRGIPYTDDYKVLNGIYWRLRSGSPRDENPERYGPYTTCYNRFVRWGKAGVWDRIFEAVSQAYDGDLQMIDSTSIQVHQHAANARGAKAKKGGAKAGRKAPAAAGHGAHARCMGRSRGGLTTKIHALVDANGLPVALKLTPGQAHDGRRAEDMLATVGKGQTLIADAGYDSDRLRAELKHRKAKCRIKPMPNRKRKYRPRKAVYAQPNRVERFFNCLKHFRAIATRFEKNPDNYARAELRLGEKSPGCREDRAQ